MSYPTETICDSLARRILMDYAFVESDLPEQDKASVTEWVAAYPGSIRTAHRALASALFDMLAPLNLDTEQVAITLISAAHDAATLLEARQRRAKAAAAPAGQPNPAFMSWLHAELARDRPPEEWPVVGKNPLPPVLYARLKREAARAGRPPPALYVSEGEEDDLLLRLLEDVARAEPSSGTEA